MVLSRSLEKYISLGVRTVFPASKEGLLWDSVMERIEEYERSGVARFQSERYRVTITRGDEILDSDGVSFPSVTYRVMLKSSGASWVVPRIGTCVESFVMLAASECESSDTDLSRSIENLLQELAEEVSEVIGMAIPGWCDSRADVVDVFHLVAPHSEIVFPLTSGNRYHVQY